MNFTGLKINGASLIDLDKKTDARGFLARVWDNNFALEQGYLTYSKKKGTMRGFHYLKVPEQKLTRVVRGSVYEVIIDVRPDSPTFKQWQGLTINAADYRMLYMGPGIAHAILTLEDNTELLSLYSPAYQPGNERGIRYNDPGFNIPWPVPVKSISEKDKNWEDFQ